MSSFRDILKGLRDIIYPDLCLICRHKLYAQRADSFVCPGCWAKIKKNTPPFCRRCGRHLKERSLTGNICPSCVRRPPIFDRAFCPCSYEGVLKELIQDFKYRNKDFLGGILSSLMAEFIREYELPLEFIDSIIPIPLHKTRLREREFNQSQILAAHLSEEFGIEMLTEGLIRNRSTRAQADLEGEARLENVKGSFSVKQAEKVRGKNILLVDDVLTTGATSSEAASALKSSGANIVFILSLAN